MIDPGQIVYDINRKIGDAASKVLEFTGDLPYKISNPVGDLIVPFDSEAYQGEAEVAEKIFQQYLPRYRELREKGLTDYQAVCRIPEEIMDGYKKFMEEGDYQSALQEMTMAPYRLSEFFAACAYISPLHRESLAGTYGAAGAAEAD